MALSLQRRADGTLIIGNSEPLGDCERTMVDWLEVWAQQRPQQTFIAERNGDDGWFGITYAEALDTTIRIAGLLLDLGASPERPVMILSGNSVSHAQVMLAGLYAGVPVSPVSPAYALMSQDFERLSSVFGTLQPSVVYVEDATPFANAIAAMRGRFDFELLTELPQARDVDAERVASARNSITSKTVAKILFTSGSTGAPKGVINTHGMWSANQQQISHAWPFLAAEPPVLLDWLPWNHTFGGNHNFGLVLRHGGTMYIDDGKATETGVAKTVHNLAAVSPTLFMNVPKGYDLLVPHLEKDGRARHNLFRNLRLIKSAAAALPAHLAEKLRALASKEGREAIPIVTGWGATETAPGVTLTPLDVADAKGIGLPMRGIEIKMIPAADATDKQTYELRVRGPNITPGYWRRPDLSASIFDEEGFYRIGDLGRFIDAQRPELGIAFAGRTAEAFKLSTGTWVQATALRVRAIEAFAPLVQDVAVAGSNRDFIGLLLFMNWANCRLFLGSDSGHLIPAQVARDSRIVEAIEDGMAALARGGGSSTFAARCLIETEPPSHESGEVTDKGYLNQAAVLRSRAESIERLYASRPDADVISL